MQVQIRTDKHIEGGEALAEHVRTVVEKTLYHYAERVSRVEVHLSDLNADKSGTHDHNCTMEARPKGMDPVAASHRAGNVHQAVDGAAKSLLNLLRSRFGKLDDRQGAPKLPFKEGEV